MGEPHESKLTDYLTEALAKSLTEEGRQSLLEAENPRRDPEGLRPPDPEGLRPPDPEGLRPPDPEGLRPPDPEGLRPPRARIVHRRGPPRQSWRGPQPTTALCPCRASRVRRGGRAGSAGRCRQGRFCGVPGRTAKQSTVSRRTENRRRPIPPGEPEGP